MPPFWPSRCLSNFMFFVATTWNEHTSTRYILVFQRCLLPNHPNRGKYQQQWRFMSFDRLPQRNPFTPTAPPSHEQGGPVLFS